MVWFGGGSRERSVNWRTGAGVAALCSQLHCPGRGEVQVLEEMLVGVGVTIPMPPLKKLVAYKKMGDTVGGSGIPSVSSDLLRQISQIHKVSSDSSVRF